MGYFRRGALIERFSSIATAGGSTALANNSTTGQLFTGSANQTVVLPDATTCDGGTNNTGGQRFNILNRSTGKVTVNNFSGGFIVLLDSGKDAVITLSNDTTAAGVWRVEAFNPEKSPLQIKASVPADALVNITANVITNLDGTGTTTPPISSLIPSVVASTHNLQTGATAGATFINAALPASTIGQYRRVGYTLLASGSINVIYSAEAATLGALANPGTIFVKNGTPIGWIDIEATGATAFKTAGSATSIVENIVGGVSRISRFGNGGGGGSGTGDANEILERLKDYFDDSLFNILTAGIFSIEGDDKVDVTSTGAYNLVDGTFNLTAAQTLVTKNLIDATEFGNDNALGAVDLAISWLQAFIDTAATYFVSRNGGNEWQQVTPERIGLTGEYRAYHTFTDEAVNQDVSTQLTIDGQQDLDITNMQEWSQSFTLTDKILAKSLNLYFVKTGTPDGYLYAGICADNAGSPGNLLSESVGILINGLSAGVNQIDIPDVYLAPGTYHIKVRTNASYKATFNVSTKKIQIGTGAGAVPYAKRYNGSAWASHSSTKLYYALKGITLDLRIKIVASMTSKLSGFGICYEKMAGNVVTGALEQEVFQFSGDADQTEFTLTKFVPHPDLLKVYDQKSGQVYLNGVWSLRGQKVVFSAGQFLAPGETIKLVFDQTGGSAFDNSDRNALLLAGNFLGSTDLTLDKSQPGRGVFLRSPNGTLFEVTVADDGSIATYSV